MGLDVRGLITPQRTVSVDRVSVKVNDHRLASSVAGRGEQCGCRSRRHVLQRTGARCAGWINLTASLAILAAVTCCGGAWEHGRWWLLGGRARRDQLAWPLHRCASRRVHPGIALVRCEASTRLPPEAPSALWNTRRHVPGCLVLVLAPAPGAVAPRPGQDGYGPPPRTCTCCTSFPRPPVTASCTAYPAQAGALTPRSALTVPVDVAAVVFDEHRDHVAIAVVVYRHGGRRLVRPTTARRARCTARCHTTAVCQQIAGDELGHRTRTLQVALTASARAAGPATFSSYGRS